VSRWVESVRPFWPAFIAAAVGGCVMGGFLIHSFINGDLMSEGRVLLDMPWGVMSLVDLYIGLLLFSGWIWWREPRRSVALLWTLALMFSGNLGSCLYVLIAILRSNGQLECFISGPRRTKNKSNCHSTVESTS